MLIDAVQKIQDGGLDKKSNDSAKSDEVTVRTSNVTKQTAEASSRKSIYQRPPMKIQPRRTISFKHGASDRGSVKGLDDEDEEPHGVEAKDPEQENGGVSESGHSATNHPTEFEQHMFQSRKRKQEEQGKGSRIRRCHLSDQSPNPDDNILICDSAADQCVIGQGFKILFHTGQHLQLSGAMAGMEGGRYPIVSAAAVVQDESRDDPIVIIVNQAAYNKDAKQNESLLHTWQARLHGVKVNDLGSFLKDSHGYSGKQNIETEGVKIPLCYDGSKYFLRIRELTDQELEQLPA